MQNKLKPQIEIGAKPSNYPDNLYWMVDETLRIRKNGIETFFTNSYDKAISSIDALISRSNPVRDKLEAFNNNGL